MKKFIAIFLLGGCASSGQNAPSFYSLHENLLETSCHGQGPSLDFARLEALQSCRATAAQVVGGGYLEVNERTWETVGNAYADRTTQNRANVKGLSCQPLEEEVLVSEPTHAKVRLRCRFDLSTAKVEPLVIHGPMQEPLVRVSGKVHLPQPSFLVWVASLPGCQTITVRGQGDHQVNCQHNPQAVSVKSGAHSLLIEAEGHAPQEVRLDSATPNQRIIVVLEKL